MAEQQQWFAGKPEENFGLSLASDTEAYAGHLGKARELTMRSVASAIHADSKENGAISHDNSALREAAFGNAREAKQAAAEALKLAPSSQSVAVEAALAFAMAGDAARAESLAQELNKRFPLDTQLQSLWLPAIGAQLALDKKNPASALSALQAAAPIELGQIQFVLNLSCLYPMDGSVSPSGHCSCQRLAIENFAGRGCRCRPRAGARRLQRISYAVEGRRSRHSHPERSQGRVREAAVMWSCA
jgi:hypothetical protein